MSKSNILTPAQIAGIEAFARTASAPYQMGASKDEVLALLASHAALVEELQSCRDEVRRYETGEWKCECCGEWKPMEESNVGDDCDLCRPCAVALEEQEARAALNAEGTA